MYTSTQAFHSLTKFIRVFNLNKLILNSGNVGRNKKRVSTGYQIPEQNTYSRLCVVIAKTEPSKVVLELRPEVMFISGEDCSGPNHIESEVY